METAEKIKTVMAKVFSMPVENIDDNSSIDTVERWDSIGQMNLVLMLEEEFGIQFTDSQMVEMLNYPLVVMGVSEALAN